MREDILADKELYEKLDRLNSWTIDQDQRLIYKELEFHSFKSAISFLGLVAEIAEQHNHHPDFLSSYCRLKITLTTHDASGLTEKDIALALEIDQAINSKFSDHLLCSQPIHSQ
jgi:4a-hydroxytetrahydrobiopterin dehydratase